MENKKRETTFSDFP